MYRGFCVAEDTINDLTLEYLLIDSNYDKHDATLAELNKKSETITSNIAKIIQGDARGIIDGEALQQACMPTGADRYDVFISHSHISEVYAKDLAVYLFLKYGVKCFVDGFVWGSCDNDILRPIDRKWSKHDTKTGSYSYEKRNYSTSHVHAMLSMALLEMIDQCECCIFIKPETDYSILGIKNMTLSPWIYEEITMFNKVEKRKPNRITRCTESFSTTEQDLKIRYKLDLSNMPELRKSHFQTYICDEYDARNYTRAYKWLDNVYDKVK